MENKQKGSNVLNLFNDIGREIVSKPHSFIRGISASVATYTGLETINIGPILDVIHPAIKPALTVTTGALTYVMHRKREDENRLNKQLYSPQHYKNRKGRSSQTAITFANVATGVLGLVSTQGNKIEDAEAYAIVALTGVTTLLARKAVINGLSMMGLGPTFSNIRRSVDPKGHKKRKEASHTP